MEASNLQAALRTTAMATVPNAKNSQAKECFTTHSYTHFFREDLVRMNPVKPMRKEVPEHPEGCIFRPSGYAGLERFPYGGTRRHTVSVLVRSIVGVHGDAGRADAFTAGNELNNALPAITDAIKAEMETFAAENNLTVEKVSVNFASKQKSGNPFGFSPSGADLVARIIVRAVVIENETTFASAEDLETLYNRYGKVGQNVRDYGLSNYAELIAYLRQVVADAQ